MAGDVLASAGGNSLSIWDLSKQQERYSESFIADSLCVRATTPLLFVASSQDIICNYYYCILTCVHCSCIEMCVCVHFLLNLSYTHLLIHFDYNQSHNGSTLCVCVCACVCVLVCACVV